jgi:aldose 1-epimerase
MKPITLKKNNLCLIVAPESGASIITFAVKKNEQWLTLIPETSFLMIPYSNRIANGEFVFENKKYQLQNAKEHAIHGDVRARLWRIENINEQAISCSFNSKKFSDINWPWPFTAKVEYILQGNQLISHLSLTNTSDSNMPAGFGWHPYFSRYLTHQDEPVYLQAKVAKAYPDANDNRIPSGPLLALQEYQDFSSKKLLAKDNFLDTCFYGYDGNGYIAWPDSGIKLIFKASSNCSHLVIYNPAEDFFAIEPVTNANNGVNLYTQGDKTSGIVSLAPDETLAASLTFTIESI